MSTDSVDAEVVIDQWIDSVYGGIDSLMSAGHFAAVDVLLEDANPDELPVVIGLAYLTITVPAAHLLTKRDAYRDRLCSHLLTIRTPKDVEALLRGL